MASVERNEAATLPELSRSGATWSLDLAVPAHSSSTAAGTSVPIELLFSEANVVYRPELDLHFVRLNFTEANVVYQPEPAPYTSAICVVGLFPI
ncbi:unnamed protein product [Pylaiella littoralis]